MSTPNNGEKLSKVLTELGLDKKLSLYVLLIIKIFALISHRNEILPEHYLDIRTQGVAKETHILYTAELLINFAINILVELGLMIGIIVSIIWILVHSRSTRKKNKSNNQSRPNINEC